MSFTDLDLQREYRSLTRNVVKDFYVPVLSESIRYCRAVGFFSSSALVSLTEGIKGLLVNGGTIEVIASPRLSEEDYDAIKDGIERRDQVILDALLRNLDEPTGRFEEARLNLLSNLIASGVMTIKIALLESGSEIGMFHEKLGLMFDAGGNCIAFSGSMNESANAYFKNYESIDVFTSWSDEHDRVCDKKAAFSAMWNDNEPGVVVLDFPQVSQAIMKKYKIRDGVDLKDLDIEQPSSFSETDNPDSLLQNVPILPGDIQLRTYQMEALEAWERNRFRGVFDMATGTGKTFTGLAAICRISERLNHNLAVVIVCPYQHLVEQWVDDIRRFNMNPIIGYSSSRQKWESLLDDAIRDQRTGVAYAGFFCFICTNGTYATDRVQRMLSKIRSPKLLVVDEAHNFGAEYLRSLLRDDFAFRLALSATIERYGDIEGTEALFSYFGPRCIEYTLEEAIYGRGDEPPCLTPYRYHPVVVYLENDELELYSQLSREIAKAVRVDNSGRKRLTEHGKILALKRARLVAAAHQKIPALEREIGPYTTDHFILVYCGATKTTVDANETPNVDGYELRQIDAVTRLLGDNLDMKVRQFTSRENSREREEITKMFSHGELQALIAIKCLDEGVNIPMIKTAFILASTTNPREYVQRRGRLLRKDKNGLKQRAEIYDFITLSRPANEAASLPDEDTQGEKRLAYNELIRAREFARLAENHAQVSQLLDEIEEGFFGIEGMAAYQNSEVE